MLTIAPFNNEDFNRLISWITTKEFLFQFAGPILFNFPITNEQLEIYVKNNNRRVYKVINHENISIIGHAEIEIEKNRIGKLCRILIGDSKLRGLGYGTLVVSELLKIAFTELELNSAELNVYTWNKGAIKCYEKAGFRVDASKTKSTLVNNKTWTSINMKITKAKWEMNNIKQI